jgi:hypothetical protein
VLLGGGKGRVTASQFHILLPHCPLSLCPRPFHFSVKSHFRLAFVDLIDLLYFVFQIYTFVSGKYFLCFGFEMVGA